MGRASGQVVLLAQLFVKKKPRSGLQFVVQRVSVSKFLTAGMAPVDAENV